MGDDGIERATARDARMRRVHATSSLARYRVLEALKLELDHELATSDLRRLAKPSARGSLRRNLEILSEAGLIEPISGESADTVWRLRDPRRPLAEWRETDITDRRTASTVLTLRRMVTKLRFDRIRQWEERKARSGPAAPLSGDGSSRVRVDLEINSDGLLVLTKAEVSELERRLNEAVVGVSERSRERRRRGDKEDGEHTIFLTMIGFPVQLEDES